MARIRRKYLDEIIRTVGTHDIKVITGVRRSGKSFLLADFRRFVEENIDDANVISLDLSSLETEGLREYHALHDYVEERYVRNRRNFVLLDEIQMCEGFEWAINSLHASGKYDIYITGSNAFLAASDLATLFVGRTYSIEVYPFSLAEFMDYFGYQDRHDALRRYLREGGMAGSYDYRTLTDKYNYLQEIYDTLIVRDIEQKHNLKNKAAMEQLSDFLMDNISRLTSARNIVNALAANGTEISHKTIGEYLKYLRAAYAFYRVRRYDIKGKRYLSSVDKFYLVDHAFRYAKLGTKTPDFGSAYENIVAIELLRRGYEVYVGTMRRSEIDFVAIKNGSKQYIQVAYLVDDEATMRREVAPLMDIPGGYQKLLIAGTRQPELEYEGIRILDLADWLLDEE